MRERKHENGTVEIVIMGPGGCATGMMQDHVFEALRDRFKAAEPYERNSIAVVGYDGKKRVRYRAPKYAVKGEMLTPKTVTIRIVDDDE